MSKVTKMIVVRIPEDLYDEVTRVSDDREIPFREGLKVVLRAGVSRVRALDRHAVAKAAKAKASKKKRR